MPYLKGPLKGELKVAEIRKIIRLHNKLSKITIPVRSTRDQIIKIVNDSGYTINHKKEKFVLTDSKKRDLSLEEAKETFPVKKRVKKPVVKKAVIVDKKPITIKKTKKEDEVRPAKIPYPVIPPNVRGKRIKVKIGKPSGRVNVGSLNVGKIDNTPAPEKLGRVKTAVKKIDDSGAGTGLKPKSKDKKAIRKQLEEQADFIGVFNDVFTSDDELRKKIKDERKRIEEGNAILCSSQIKRLLTDLRDIISGNDKYAEIMKSYGKEKIKYADYRTKFIEGANEIIKQYKTYKRICTDEEISNIKKGLEIMEKYPKVQGFNKRKKSEPKPKKEEPKKKKVLFINENDDDVKAEKKEKPPPRFPFEVPEVKEGKKKNNNEKLENDLIDLESESNLVSKNIRDAKGYSFNKASAVESVIFKDSDYKNYNDMKRAFTKLQKEAQGIKGGELVNISDTVNDIKDQLAFIKDNIKDLKIEENTDAQKKVKPPQKETPQKETPKKKEEYFKIKKNDDLTLLIPNNNIRTFYRDMLLDNNYLYLEEMKRMKKEGTLGEKSLRTDFQPLYNRFQKNIINDSKDSFNITSQKIGTFLLVAELFADGDTSEDSFTFFTKLAKDIKALVGK